jgi:hypothetical protein
MSAHTVRPGSRPCRSPDPATWAAAAIALLTAACTSTASATGSDTAASVVTALGPRLVRTCGASRTSNDRLGSGSG